MKRRRSPSPSTTDLPTEGQLALLQVTWDDFDVVPTILVTQIWRGVMSGSKESLHVLKGNKKMALLAIPDLFFTSVFHFGICQMGLWRFQDQALLVPWILSASCDWDDELRNLNSTCFAWKSAQTGRWNRNSSVLQTSVYQKWCWTAIIVILHSTYYECICSWYFICFMYPCATVFVDI